MNVVRPLATCHILESQRGDWLRSFLPLYEPFFLQGEEHVKRLLQAGMIVYTLPEFRASFPTFSLDYGCTYRLWDIPEDAYVWMANATQRLQIDANLLREIFIEQARLQRGQVYDDTWRLRLQNEQAVRDLDEESWQSFFEHSQIHNLERQFILTHDVWTTLPENVQVAWLLEWLNDQLLDDEVKPVDPHALPIPASHRPLVMKYSGRFADVSGANCFAATLALALGELTRAENVINLWLHQEPFLRMLRAEGYGPISEIHSGDKIDAIEPLDVLIWSDKDGRLVHASFCVAPGYVFNKMGQSWEQPWLVLPIEVVSDYDEAVSQGGKLTRYRREKTNV